MEKLNELMSKACLASERGKKGITVDLQMLSQIRDEFWAVEKRAEAAEAKLAELDKQKPVGTVSISMDWNTHRNIATVNMRPDLVVAEMKNGDELFTRPAPVVSLAELVPPERNNWESTDEEGYDIDYMEPSDILQMGKDEGFNLCRAAIMRNIEESK